MTDITKCSGTNCPVREQCYRYTAPSGQRQSMAAFEKYLDGDRCGQFYPNAGNKYILKNGAK